MPLFVIDCEPAERRFDLLREPDLDNSRRMSAGESGIRRRITVVILGMSDWRVMAYDSGCYCECVNWENSLSFSQPGNLLLPPIDDDALNDHPFPALLVWMSRV